MPCWKHFDWLSQRFLIGRLLSFQSNPGMIVLRGVFNVYRYSLANRPLYMAGSTVPDNTISYKADMTDGRLGAPPPEGGIEVNSERKVKREGRKVGYVRKAR